jgi:hypothetical protein
MRKIILVSQVPARRSKEPLDGASGRRLAALAGLDHQDFMTRFERVALEPNGRLAAAALMERADALREQWNGRKVVFLGDLVAAAFRLQTSDYQLFAPIEIPPGIEAAIMPNPGRAVAWWNTPEHVEQARQFMQRLNVGFLAPIRRGSEKRSAGRPEQFTPEQVAASLFATDGILTEAAKMIAEETGRSCDRQTVANYCERYPALQEIRDRCVQDLGDIAEANVWRAVREGDAEMSLKLLRCKMFAGRGYELMVEGRMKHEGSVQVDVRVQVQDLRESLLREVGAHATLIEHEPARPLNNGNGRGNGAGH